MRIFLLPYLSFVRLFISFPTLFQYGNIEFIVNIF